MDSTAREILRKLVEELGSNVSENPQKWRGYLNDRLAHYRLERQALTTALNDLIPEELLSSQLSIAPQVQVERLSLRLVEHHGLQPEVARWAVESWAIALGVLDATKASPTKLDSTKSNSNRTEVSLPPKRESSVTQVSETASKRRWAIGLIAIGAIGAISATALIASKPNTSTLR